MLPDTNLIAISSLCTSLSLSLVALTVNNLPAMLETQVQSLGKDDPLEKGMATHSSIPAWRIPWPEEPDGPWCKEWDMTERLSTHKHWVSLRRVMLQSPIYR